MSQFHSFSVDGVLLTGVDGFGCLWTVEGLQGWYAGGAVRADSSARTGQSGDWLGQPSRAGRVVTLRGKVQCPDAASKELAGRRLSAVLASGQPGTLVGDSPAGFLSSTVVLNDEPLFESWSSNIATWQLTVASDDPHLYGLDWIGQTTLAATAPGAGQTWPQTWPQDWGVAPGVTPGAVSVPNAGTVSYHPRLRVDGPVSGFAVTLLESGASVRYRGSVAAGQWLDIDCRDRTVLLNGLVSHRHLTSFTGDWLAVPPGGGTVSWSANSFGDGHLLSVLGYEGAWA